MGSLGRPLDPWALGPWTHWPLELTCHRGHEPLGPLALELIGPWGPRLLGSLETQFKLKLYEDVPPFLGNIQSHVQLKQKDSDISIECVSGTQSGALPAVASPPTSPRKLLTTF